MKYKLLIAFFYFFCFTSFGQDAFIKKVKSNKVKKYLIKQELTTKESLNKLSSACIEPNEGLTHYDHSKSYTVNLPLETTWQGYKSLQPNAVWSSKRSKFQFQYSPDNNKVSFKNEKGGGFKAGNLVFLKLKVLGGLIKLAVGSRLKEVNENDHFLEFCYVNGGTTNGSQYIRFEKINATTTLVTHDTYYISGKKFRDVKLYPKIHEKMINSFHKNIIKQIENQAKTPTLAQQHIF